jgi:hypothetical protein
MPMTALSWKSSKAFYQKYVLRFYTMADRNRYWKHRRRLRKAMHHVDS